MWGGLLSAPPAPHADTHVPALRICTMTSLHWTTTPLGGCHDPATRTYRSDGNYSKNMEKYLPRGDLKVAYRKVDLNMLWDFWNFWRNLQRFEGPGIDRYLVFLLTSLLDFKGLHQSHTDNPILKREGKQVIQNEALERSRITARDSSSTVLKELRALSSSNHGPTSHDICKWGLRSLILNLCQRRWVPRTQPLEKTISWEYVQFSG